MADPSILSDGSLVVRFHSCQLKILSMIKEIECSLYVYNPDHHNQVTQAEKLGYDIPPDKLSPKYLKMPFTFAPIDVLAFYQDQSIEGCTVVFMHSTHFMIDYPYQELKQLRIELMADADAARLADEAR
jgi:hypothetical protein